jgi:glycosyltransferase involved in cell wall biosynthesis
MLNHLISVVIPSFNRGELLKDTLNSLLNQTYSHWECIIIDDGSTDNTLVVALKFAEFDRRFIVRERGSDMKKGANTCRNLGLKYSSGSFIKWLDSDDILNSECLEKQVRLMDDVDVNFCQANFFVAEETKLTFIPGKVWGRLIPYDGENMVHEYLMNGLRWQTACGLWKKPFLDRQPFLEGLQNSQEWLMHLNMLLRKPRVSFLNENLVHVRSHQESMSNSRNKRGSYYYHQCKSRLEAISLLRDRQKLNSVFYKKIMKFFIWNHLFTFYKGDPLKGLSLLAAYPRLISYFFAAR